MWDLTCGGLVEPYPSKDGDFIIYGPLGAVMLAWPTLIAWRLHHPDRDVSMARARRWRWRILATTVLIIVAWVHSYGFEASVGTEKVGSLYVRRAGITWTNSRDGAANCITWDVAHPAEPLAGWIPGGGMVASNILNKDWSWYHVAVMPLYLVALTALSPRLWILPLLFARGRGSCANCDYDLTGNLSGICPERGAATRTLEPST